MVMIKKSGLMNKNEKISFRQEEKPALGGVVSVVHFITGHEQTQLNRNSDFHFFSIFFVSLRSNYSEFVCLYITIVPYDGRKTLSPS